MPIAKTATTLRTKLDDAPHGPHAPRATHEAAVVDTARTREPEAPEATTLDAGLEDPYDNIACTD
jgi:hypothetical protein